MSLILVLFGNVTAVCIAFSSLNRLKFEWSRWWFFLKKISDAQEIGNLEVDFVTGNSVHIYSLACNSTVEWHSRAMESWTGGLLRRLLIIQPQPEAAILFF